MLYEVITGANTTESHPVFGAAIKRAQTRGARLIVADPRRTELAARADIHLQMQPGTDVALFNAMLNHVLAEGLESRAFIVRRTHGFEAVRQAVAPYTPERAAAITGIPADLIRRVAETYARGPNTSRITSYNVCYTKLLRMPAGRQPRGLTLSLPLSFQVC